VLIIDEFMDLMIRRQLTAAAVEALLALSGVGRKKLVFVVLISQNWGVNLLGRAGVAIRQNTTHALVCRSSEETAKFLLPSSYAQQAMMLQPGQCLFFGGGTPVLTTAPYLSDADLRYAARGRPPRPYVPRLAAPVSAVAAVTNAPTTNAPTTPLPLRSAPPTEALPLPTVQEQIIDLLVGQPWLTSTEIAAALGVDVNVVRTELSSLYRKRAIIRRTAQRDVPEKYEYACQPINQPINTGVSLTA
jgi:DNA-binding CsgD family transcriptional regulator